MRTLILLMLVIFFGCQSNPVKKYKNQVGDTDFDVKFDNPNFKFCDSARTFHSRTKIWYTGGNKALENELIQNYKFSPNFEDFTGYFFIRFAVNCKNELGRFRWDIVDENHEKTNCPKQLENHLITLVKSLKNWNHVTYNENSYDGYTFLIVKLKQGKIIQS